jgi:DNA repair protein RecO (recombination protein O)
MALQKAEALILRNLRMGDTSRIVTVLSREFGKWSGVAKGARNPKSRFGAALEILNHSHLVCYFRAGRDLKLISDAFLERESRGLFRQSERYHYGCAVAEMCDRILEEEAVVPDIFDLTLRVLGLMEEAPLGRLEYLFSAYQLRFAGRIGYAPRLDRCVGCGRPEASAFEPADGGILCGTCAQRGSSSLPIAGSTLDLMRRIQSGALPRDPSGESVRQLSAATHAFLSFHIDRYRTLRSLRALSGLDRLRPASAGPPRSNGAEVSPPRDPE